MSEAGEGVGETGGVAIKRPSQSFGSCRRQRSRYRLRKEVARGAWRCMSGGRNKPAIDRCGRGDHPLSGLDGLARFSAVLVGGLPD